MPIVTCVFGLLLIGLGAWSYYYSAAAKFSYTMLIPVWFGLALDLLGLLALAGPKARKHAMHLAAVVALLGAVGALMRLNFENFGKVLTGGLIDEVDRNKAIAQGGMAILCLVLLGLYILSFIRARRARQTVPVSDAPEGR